ncbi:hypothetical protein [Microseira wollei]|uniref:hypothetical protein n=1 Tax=Microseira wollei TaxID=467598 RepID=UPI001CFDB682|nr:hypothetical protein [Microseira wollei]
MVSILISSSIDSNLSPDMGETGRMPIPQQNSPSHKRTAHPTTEQPIPQQNSPSHNRTAHPTTEQPIPQDKRVG